MFAYCDNNPINYSDYSGTFAKEIGIGSLALMLVTGLIFVIGIVWIVAYSLDRLNPNVTFDFSLPSISVPTMAELADENLRADIKKGKSEGYLYWKAHRVGGHVVLGKGLTKEEALLRASAGKDVFTVSGTSAYWLAWEAGGGTVPQGPEIDRDKENTPGYYYHYHPTPKNGAHIFFI